MINVTIKKADEASRGFDSKKKNEIQRLFDGPSFLYYLS